MHAVFLFSETIEIDSVGDESILLFETEQDAIEFVIELFIENGFIDRVSPGCFVVPGMAGEFDADQAIENVQDTFSPLEFCHIYAVADMRKSKV